MKFLYKRPINDYKKVRSEAYQASSLLFLMDENPFPCFLLHNIFVVLYVHNKIS